MESVDWILPKDPTSEVLSKLPLVEQKRLAVVSKMFQRAVAASSLKSVPDGWLPETVTAFRSSQVAFLKARAASEVGVDMLRWGGSTMEGFVVAYGATIAAVEGADGVFVLYEGPTQTTIVHGQQTRPLPDACVAERMHKDGEIAVSRCGPLVKGASVRGCRITYSHLSVRSNVSHEVNKGAADLASIYGAFFTPVLLLGLLAVMSRRSAATATWHVMKQHHLKDAKYMTIMAAVHGVGMTFIAITAYESWRKRIIRDFSWQTGYTIARWKDVGLH